MPAPRSPKSRLTTWKEVAAYFGKGERTVMRWEAERGLPVHRLPGEARSGIYADVAELEAWLRSGGAAVATAQDGPSFIPAPAAADVPRLRIVHPPTPGRRGIPVLLRRVAPWAALPLLLALVAFAMDRQQTVPPPPAAHALYLRGLQDWAQRTPASLNAAVNEFTAAIRIDDAYAEAYVGLSNSYNLLREFAAMPASQAYPLARAAAARAIALRPDLASAHAAYAFALFNGDWNFSEGRREFETALRLEPNNAAIHHWYATALLELEERQAAMAQIDRAAELEPDSPSIQADRAFILYHSGRAAEAKTMLDALAASHQDFLSPHTYLQVIAFDTGDDDAFIHESLLRARLKQDPRAADIARAAQAALASGGHVGMLNALLQARLAALASGGGSAVDVAHIYAMLGDRPHALAYVSLAIDRHDEDSFELVRDQRISALLGDAALSPLRTRLNL
jgi:tetratricopeptide (TPR) repeat protein